MIYKVFKNEELTGEGTLDEVSQKSGLSRRTILIYANTPYQGKKVKWRVEVERYNKQKKEVNLEYLRKKIKENKNTYEELAELMEVQSDTVSKKINGAMRITDKDIAFFEDLFFMEKGELLK